MGRSKEYAICPLLIRLAHNNHKSGIIKQCAGWRQRKKPSSSRGLKCYTKVVTGVANEIFSISSSKSETVFTSVCHSLSTIAALVTASAMSTASSAMKSRVLPSSSTNLSNESSHFFVSSF